MRGKRYAIRNYFGTPQLVYIETVMNGFWRGVVLDNAKRTRGPIHTLIGRYEDEKTARLVLDTLTDPA